MLARISRIESAPLYKRTALCIIILCPCFLAVLGGLCPMQFAVQRCCGADVGADRRHQTADPEVSRPLTARHYGRW